MSDPLNMLEKKLQGQINSLQQNIESLSYQMSLKEQAIDSENHLLLQALEQPAHIVPEKEMNRLNYIICQQQKIEKIKDEKTFISSQINQLIHKKIRLEQELRMINRYIEKKQLEAFKMQQYNAEKQLDEYALINCKDKEMGESS